MPRKSRKTAASARKKPKRKDADRTQAMAQAIETVGNLKELRKATRLTQDELAAIMEMGQGAISRIEKRDDMLVSTLEHYVASVGGRLRILATFPDRPPLIVERLGKKTASAPAGPSRSGDGKPAGANGHAPG